MKRLLHIIATPRGDDSRTLKVTAAFLEVFRKKYPSCYIDTLDLFAEKLPALTEKQVDGKYVLLSGKGLTGKLEKSWSEIAKTIERFISADGYLISTPMWNFSVPYPLKHYIDVILQPKYLFRYTENGAEGLVKGKKMVVITSRGGDYSQISPLRSYDFEEPYLRAVFGFIGITDINFINAQPMDALGPLVREDKIALAKEAAKIVANVF
ncbi:MAG: NAD(P)H-dependent oxidoreductase [Candidatus Omnitrophica bacterium]|nr:NAD(P)H-dependent oxidoreductase [Candidatus Omnitrophota bacterium]